MVKVEIDFVIVDPQDDVSHLYFHEVTGWADDLSDSALKVLVREKTNIQDEIAIAFYRELPPETLKFSYSCPDADTYMTPRLRHFKDFNHYWRCGVAEGNFLAGFKNIIGGRA